MCDKKSSQLERSNLSLAGLLLAALIFLFPARPLHAQGPAPAKSPSHQGWFSTNWGGGVELEKIIKLISNATGKRILYTPDLVQGKKIYLLSKSNIPVSLAFKLLESILENNGLALVGVNLDGTVLYKLTQAQNVIKKPVPVYSLRDAQQLSLGEKMITEIIPLKYADPRDVQVALSPLTTQGQGILALADLQAVIVTDYALNVRRMADIIKLMDQQKPLPTIKIRQLEHARVSEIEPELSKLMTTLQQQAPVSEKGPRQAPPLQIIPDERTNSFILMAVPDTLKQIDSIIDKIDIPAVYVERKIHIYKLQNATAKDLATQLNEIFHGGGSSSGAGSSSAGGASAPLPTLGTGPLPPGAASSTPVTFVAAEQSNALIIVAPQSTYDDIKPVIEELDTRPPQVFLEAAIVEITANENMDIGAEITTAEKLPAANSTSTSHALRGFAGTSLGLSTLIDTNGDNIPDAKVPLGASASGFSGGLVAGVVKGSAGRIPLLLSLLRRKVKVNVLSVPQITTNDNKPAKISVEEQVPTTTTSVIGGNQTVTGFQGFQTAKTELDITPHIGEGNFLNLEIEQIIERFTGQATTANVPPPKTSKDIKTTLTVRDDKTVVLGGLVVNSTDNTSTDVPGLSSIPLLGELFKRHQSSNQKTQLFIFITPHILQATTPGFYKYMHITEEKYRQIQEETKGKFQLEFFDTGTPKSLDYFQYQSPLPREGKSGQ